MKDKEKYFLPYLYPHVSKLEKNVLHGSVNNLVKVNCSNNKQKNVEMLSRPDWVFDRERPIKFNPQRGRINLGKSISPKANMKCEGLNDTRIVGQRVNLDTIDRDIQILGLNKDERRKKINSKINQNLNHEIRRNNHIKSPVREVYYKINANFQLSNLYDDKSQFNKVTDGPETFYRNKIRKKPKNFKSENLNNDKLNLFSSCNKYCDTNENNTISHKHVGERVRDNPENNLNNIFTPKNLKNENNLYKSTGTNTIKVLYSKYANRKNNSETINKIFNLNGNTNNPNNLQLNNLNVNEGISLTNSMKNIRGPNFSKQTDRENIKLKPSNKFDHDMFLMEHEINKDIINSYEDRVYSQVTIEDELEANQFVKFENKLLQFKKNISGLLEYKNK